MKLYSHLSTFRFIKQIGLRVARWTAIDAVLGAAGGALFGGAFAGLGMLMYFDSARWAPMTAYFAACGAVAGILVGALGAVLEGEVAPEESCASYVEPRSMSRHVAPPVELQAESKPCNRLLTLAGASRPPLTTVASRNPSWN